MYMIIIFLLANWIGSLLDAFFFGYDDARKGWRCINPDTMRVYTSRHVIFDESSSWSALDKKSTTSMIIPDDSDPVDAEDDVQDYSQLSSSPQQTSSFSFLHQTPATSSSQKSPWNSGVHNSTSSNQRQITTKDAGVRLFSEEPEAPSERNKRNKKLVERYGDWDYSSFAYYLLLLLLISRNLSHLMKQRMLLFGKMP
ncbi:hypothetical protein COCNU_10G004270 [Cocos nucifera]|uniref:Retroviral polymerase SH3-like domain-containing protein n=1 Tax=Cocos nucifera TaxID=13894 RepID=A0A8K0IN76_COCNU|nr:hypothetical protein COCNU_10G004270 [Cocos nucifera]